MTTAPTEDRCSLRSLAAEEPLGGTASTIRRWLLVEHDGPWGRDGLLDARLPDGVGQALRDLGRRTAARVLLIRRAAFAGARPPHGAAACFAVDTRDAWIGRRDLERIDEATTLDPRDRSSFDEVDGHSLFVVCTHGRRDPCCAERGRPLAEAMSTAAPTTWESTHVGGDRFAANVIAFPHGIAFGRVEPSEARTLVQAFAGGRIRPLTRYRGRTSDPFDVQAAEAAVRIELRLDGLEDVRLRRRDRDRTRSSVTFSTPAGDQRVELDRLTAAPMRLTCRSSAEEVALHWRPRRISGVR